MSTQTHHTGRLSQVLTRAGVNVRERSTNLLDVLLKQPQIQALLQFEFPDLPQLVQLLPRGRHAVHHAVDAGYHAVEVGAGRYAGHAGEATVGTARVA